MAKMMSFLGQKIMIGELCGDICSYNNALSYQSAPTYFDPFKYMHDNGGYPASDHEYTFYDPSTEDDYPVFSISLIYVSDTLVRVGYKFRGYSGGSWNPWPTTEPLIPTWNDGYSYADITDITEEDRWRFGLWITYISVASEAAAQYTVGSWGFALFHENMYRDFATGDPQVDAAEYKDDLTPPHYIPGSFETIYTMFDKLGYQMNFPAFGEEWMGTLMVPIDGPEDDDSGPAGGGGKYEFPSWGIGISELPSINIIDSGIATMWTPSPAQVKSLMHFLWSDDFFDNIIKLVADPLENIIQFGVVPFDLSSWAGTAKEVKIGNVGSNVTMTPLTEQYISYDMGSISIREAWGNCLDYNNTKVSIFVPYVGTFDLTPDEVMNCDHINLRYNIDLFSGDFIAEIYVKKRMPSGIYLGGDDDRAIPMYHKSGNLMTKFPLTGANYGRVYTSILSGAANAIGQAAGGNFLGAAEAAAGAVLNANSVPVERSGQYTGVSAALGATAPYLILTQPVQVKPGKYGQMEGYPSFITYQLVTLEGFTKVLSVIDNKVSATDPEKEELERLLKEGIILPERT